MPPSISILVEPHFNGSLVAGRVTFEDSDKAYDYVSDVSLSQLQNYADSIRNNVEDYLDPNATDAQRSERLEHVAGAGLLLLDSLLGRVSSDGSEDEAYKDEIFDWMMKEGGIIHIDSDTIHAPWNFIYPSRDPQIEPENFLGSRHQVVQRLHMKGRVSPAWSVKKLFAIHGDEREMVQEADHIQRHAAAHRIECQRLPPDITKPVQDCKKTFNKLWKDFAPNVVHIASHLREARQPMSGAGASPIDSTVNVYARMGLSVGQILTAMTRERSFLELGFFNVCSLGRGRSMTDAGAAGAFANLSACSIWVDTLLVNKSSMSFADAFYGAYLSGSLPGEAFQSAKRQISVSAKEKMTSLCYRFAYRYPEMLQAMA
jgi:hypothetical protein